MGEWSDIFAAYPIARICRAVSINVCLICCGLMGRCARLCTRESLPTPQASPISRSILMCAYSPGAPCRCSVELHTRRTVCITRVRYTLCRVSQSVIQSKRIFNCQRSFRIIQRLLSPLPLGTLNGVLYKKPAKTNARFVFILSPVLAEYNRYRLYQRGKQKTCEPKDNYSTTHCLCKLSCGQLRDFNRSDERYL